MKYQDLKCNNNKVIIDLKNAYDGIKNKYDWIDRVNSFISRYKKNTIVKIKINDVEILPELSQLKIWLMDASENLIKQSRIYIETAPTKTDVETFNLMKKLCIGG